MRTPVSSRRAAAACATLLGVALAVGVVAPVRGADAHPGAAEQHAIPMDEMELASPQAGEALIPPPESAVQRSPFLHDARFAAQLRTYYFNRDKFDDSKSEAWAIGGSLSFTSGYLADLFRVGAVLYTSQPLYGPEEHDGTLLLAPGQDGYTVVGQIYGEFKFTDQIFGAIGRKEYTTPFINKNDTRMTPNTFEGITVYGRSGGKDGAPEWRFGGGYISKIKERNSDEFVWMSRDAGAAVDRGVFLGGVNYKQGSFSIGAIDYYSDDIINIFYTEAAYDAIAMPGGAKLRLAGQYTDQRSNGDNLLTGTAFSTYQWGVKADLTVGAAVLTAAYTDTSSDSAMQSPWSGYPGYTSVQVEDFFRAGESALLLKAAYDFTGHGAKGLSAYALWVHGSGVSAPNYNEDEYDFNLQWTPDKAGLLRGMSFRLRYAQVNQRGGGDPDIKDFRFIVNYDFPRP
jgi:outer membrane porin, OprD family